MRLTWVAQAHRLAARLDPRYRSGMRGRGIGAIGVVALACLLLLVGAASAATSRPTFLSFTVRPATLSAAGGWITIEARVRNAVSCTLENAVGRNRTFGCRSGRVYVREDVPPNTGKVPEVYTPHIEAHDGRSNRRSNDAEVELASDLPSPPPVNGLDECEAGPECDYGHAYETFKPWGNDAPEALGDCTFAALANWEQVINKAVPFEADLGYEFAQAGGTTTGGLSMTAMFSYWHKYEVGGARLTAWSRFAVSKANVENGVRDYGALLAELDFLQSDYFAQYQVGAGKHAIVVIGFTPEGPLVASWGEALQMTWEQWDDEATGMWAIETTKPG
jgi:hypothetical protein